MKKVKYLAITLAIVLVTMVACVGIYLPKQNRMENKVKDYSYAMDLKGARTIVLKPDTSNKTTIKDSTGKEVTDASNLTDDQLKEKGYTKEETPYNTTDNLNASNYEKSKEILEQRLKKLGVTNYVFKINNDNGEIYLEIPENTGTDNVISYLESAGKFEILDSETQEVLMNNDYIKSANVMYGSNSTSKTSSGTTVYLNIEFNKDGTKKLEDISGTYTNTTNSTNSANSENNANEESNTNTSDTSTAKKVTLKLDDETIMTTSFGETLRTGKLQLSVGSSSTDSKTLSGYVNQAKGMATVLDSGKMPIKYTVEENKYILSDVTSQDLNIVFYVIAGITAIALIVLIIRYKFVGLLGAISYVGLASLFSLLLRYTNVVISIEGIVGIVLILILSYIFMNRLLNKIKSKENFDKEAINSSLKEEYKDFFIKIIPIGIAVITFCFMPWEPVSSFGMVMFWGIALIAAYNISVTNALLKIATSKTTKTTKTTTKNKD